MSNSDQLVTANDQRKPPFQFSIAFLLWLTAACAFVLGIATWTPTSRVLLPLAAAVPATIVWAHRCGRRAFCWSIIGGTIMSGLAYGDWLVHVARFRPGPAELAESILVFLVLAIAGLLAGLALAVSIEKYEREHLPRRTEQQPRQEPQEE